MQKSQIRCLVPAFFLLAAISSAARSEEAMFRGNAAHDGTYAGVGVAHPPTVKWMFHTKGRIYSSPAVAYGSVFAGSTDGNLYAVDAITGALKWKFATSLRVVSSPAVADGAVFFESYDGNFYALDAATGALKWKFATRGERRFAAKHLHGTEPAAETMPDPFDFYLSSPAVADGRVYFGSGDGNVYALKASDGSLLWTFKTGDVVHASPAIADGTVFIGSWDRNFYALDAASGKEKWRLATGRDDDTHNQEGIQSSAAVADGMVYFGCRDSNLYALDEKTGSERWRFNNKGSWVIASPAVDGGIVYAATSDTGQFLALDAKRGAKIFSLDFKHWPMFSSPALAQGIAYIGSHQGKLFAIDLKQRHVAWEFQTDASRKLLAAYSDPNGAPDYGSVQSENFYDSLVMAMIKITDNGAVLSSPVVSGNTVIFGSNDGALYALE